MPHIPVRHRYAAAFGRPNSLPANWSNRWVRTYTLTHPQINGADWPRLFAAGGEGGIDSPPGRRLTRQAGARSLRSLRGLTGGYAAAWGD